MTWARTSSPSAAPSRGGRLRRRGPDTPPAGPAVVVVTDRRLVPAGRRLLDVAIDALEGGADAVLVRERDLPPEQRRELVATVATAAASCAARDAAVLVASPFPADLPLDAAVTVGVHLRSRESVGRVNAPGRLAGRSCHDVTDLVQAADDGLDYVTCSPVAASLSKPGYGPVLGPVGLGAAVAALRRDRRSAPTVLALGGVEACNAGQWIRAGADGVALMGAVMTSRNPGATTRAVRLAVDRVAQLARGGGAADDRDAPVGGPVDEGQR